mgnify:CR=1 FL=1
MVVGWWFWQLFSVCWCSPFLAHCRASNWRLYRLLTFALPHRARDRQICSVDAPLATASQCVPPLNGAIPTSSTEQKEGAEVAIQKGHVTPTPPTHIEALSVFFHPHS